MRTFKEYCMRVASVVLGILFVYTTLVPRAIGTRATTPAQVTPPVAPAPRQPRPQVTPPVKPTPQQKPVVEPLVQRPIRGSSQPFTQTEAYLEVPALRDELTKRFGNAFEIVRHMDIVSRVMAKEAEFRNTHWAFYHGISNVWTVWQDAYTELFKHFNPSVNMEDADFIFLRTRGQKSEKAQDFLVSTLREHGLVDDNGNSKGILLSVNVSLFGNTHLQSESTWKYMMTAKTHVEPDRELYESLMDEFDLPHTYVNELMSLVKIIETKQQTLLQIMVPKNMVDDIGYMAWATGIPAHEPSIQWVRHSGIRGRKGTPGALIALAKLRHTFKKAQEKNPLFKEMLETAEAGGFSIDDYLKDFCSDPLSLARDSLNNIDGIQARLLFSDDILLNPRSGVMMFRYTGAEYRKMREYKRRLRDIIQKTVAAKRR